MRKGKLIVIDGTDGTGKATQTKYLVEKLEKEGYKVAVEDFPRYGEKSAVLVEEYLNGVYGTAKELGPYIPSVFYAVDRFAASFRIRENLKKGVIVVSNRYVTASMGHQGGKMAKGADRNKFYKWLTDLEYKLFKIPHPDLNLILHMPAEVAQSLVDRKAPRKYIHGFKRDIHEADLKHLQAAEKNYLEIHKKFKYPLIECYVEGEILSKETVAELILAKVKKVLK